MIYIFVIFCLVVLLSSTTFAFKLQQNPRRLITKLNGGADKHSSLWDNHSPVQDIPETLVKAIDGNAVMRQKFEKLCRNAQVFTHFIAWSELAHRLVLRLRSAKLLKRSTAWESFALTHGCARQAVGAFPEFFREERLSRRRA